MKLKCHNSVAVRRVLLLTCCVWILQNLLTIYHKSCIINHQWSKLASVRHIKNNDIAISIRPVPSNDSISRRQTSVPKIKKKEQIKLTNRPSNKTNKINMSVKHARDGFPKKKLELVV